MPVLSNEFSKHVWKTITSGQHHSIALDDQGKVHAIGRKEYGRLGLGKDCEDAMELKIVDELKEKQCVDVACGSATSFAVTNVGKIYVLEIWQQELIIVEKINTIIEYGLFCRFTKIK